VCGADVEKVHRLGQAAQAVRTLGHPGQLIGLVTRLSCGVGDQHGSRRCQVADPARHVHRAAEPVPATADRKSGGDSCSQRRQPFGSRGIDEFKDCIDEACGVGRHQHHRITNDFDEPHGGDCDVLGESGQPVGEIPKPFRGKRLAEPREANKVGEGDRNVPGRAATLPHARRH
jgi:hypothetical protein